MTHKLRECLGDDGDQYTNAVKRRVVNSHSQSSADEQALYRRRGRNGRSRYCKIMAPPAATRSPVAPATSDQHIGKRK